MYYISIASSDEFNVLQNALGKVDNLKTTYEPRLNTVESQFASIISFKQSAILEIIPGNLENYVFKITCKVNMVINYIVIVGKRYSNFGSTGE